MIIIDLLKKYGYRFLKSVVLAIFLFLSIYGLWQVYELHARQVYLIEALGNQNKKIDELSADLVKLELVISDQKRALSSIALSVKTGNSEEAEQLVTWILQAHHDIGILARALIAQQLFFNDSERISWWLSQLDFLSIEQRRLMIESISQRKTWLDFSQLLARRLQKESPDHSGNGILNIMEKFGVKVEQPKNSETEILLTLQNYVDTGRYHDACQLQWNTDIPHDIVEPLQLLCTPEHYIIEQWKNSAS
ncbi:MAG: hypothetical protein FJ161_00420 [Gammaproteobacteria bacterium]|nr:hypothetical protein [Gammaproteobacteria bacterium]